MLVSVTGNQKLITGDLKICMKGGHGETVVTEETMLVMMVNEKYFTYLTDK